MTRILVVDDEPAITRMIKLHLEAVDGFEVFTETRASRVIDAARTFRPDLIVLDILMPDALGTELAARLADDPATRNIKVIFLTAILKKGEEPHRGEIIGGQRILAKPVSTEELLAAIREELA